MSTPDPEKIAREITPQEALQILRAAEGALSHASYCGITRSRVEKQSIDRPWDDLRALIECLSPNMTFEEVEPDPTLMFAPFAKEIDGKEQA